MSVRLLSMCMPVDLSGNVTVLRLVQERNLSDVSADKYAFPWCYFSAEHSDAFAGFASVQSALYKKYQCLRFIHIHTYISAAAHCLLKR